MLARLKGFEPKNSVGLEWIYAFVFSDVGLIIWASLKLCEIGLS